MSLPRPSGLKAPSKIGRPSGLPSVAPAVTKSAILTGIPAASKAQKIERRPGPEPEESIVISEDDFKIGDRVWVSGSKPGIIAFIGETQFAPGEWAGVVLDDPVGKNDGSVMGVRYFQCEMKRGVFSRLSKLTATPQPQAADSATNSATSQPTRASFSSLDGTTNGIALSGSAATSPTALTSTPRLGLGSSRAQSGSSSSLHKASPPASTANLHSPSPSAAAARVGLKIGDKVLISGSKPGVLKYVGETDFAKGVWAGVELDEPLGKNDGAVAGKRYFDCKPMHGLFAPVHKVARLAGAMSVSTPSPGSRSLGLRSARERSTSQESVSSISSSASSVSRSRANKSGQRPSTLNLSATTAALQKALKEKEEHIEQLLRERDLERSEVARAAAQVDEAEGQLTTLKSEQERFRGDAEDIIVRLRLQVAELEKEKEALSTKLEDERRRVEDLQFQIEEEVICKDDLETTKEEDEIRMRELEKSFFREKSRADELEKELKTLKMQSEKHQNHLKDTEATQSLYLDQIEDLTYKLTQAENRIKQFESSRLEEGAKSSQVGVELSEKMSRICELEDLVSGQRRDLKHAQDRLQEVQEELTASNNRCKKLQDTLDEVTNKVHGMENQHSKIHDELCSAKSQTCDLQRQLAANKEKTAELAEERNRVEQQIADLMKNSGDSSKQLSTLNGQLAEKTRKLEEQQNDLLSYSQQIAKLNETLEETQRAKDREREGIVHKFEEQMKSLQSQLEDMQLELEKSRNKLTKVTEEAEQERAEIIGRKEAEIQQLKQRMEAQTEEVNKHELQTQAHKEYLEKVCIELESVKYEKEKAEKAVRRIEGERDVFNTELIQVRVMLSKLQSQNTDVQKTISAFEEQVQNLQAEKDHIMHSKQEVEKQRDDLRAEKDRISHDREALHKDYIILKAEMQKRDIQIDEMKKEMERLQQMTEKRQEELMQRSQTEADMLTEELEDSKKILKETHASLKEKESEVIKLKAEVEISKLVIEERKRLEDENVRLKKELEDLNESYRKQVVNLENERTTLHGRADNFSQELSKQKKLLEEQSAQLAALKSENQLLLEKKSALETQDSTISSDKKILADRVVKLEEALAVAEKIRANTALQSGEPASSVQLEKDVDSSQVEFLNSVIVDLQRKNKEMEARLEAMTSGTLDGVADNELIGIPGRRSKPAPRLFCDICDMFDQHDTDDCPKQAMSDSPPPTFNHGERKSLRPYCEICEYFIDPNAVDKHTHSQLADAFFRQCIGFTSDDDVDSELSQESSNGTRSGSGSPQKRGVHLPSLILSRADSLKCSEEKLRNETAHDPISKPLSDLMPRSGGENVPEEKEGVKNIASLGADHQLAGGKNQSVQDGELEDDMKLMSQNASVGEKTTLGNYTEDEEYFSDSTLQEDLINTKSFQQTAPYESSPDIQTSLKELIANKTSSLFETGNSSLSGNNSSEIVSSLNTYANQKTPEMARKVESKLKEKSYLPFSTPESTTPDRDLQSPTLELDEPDSTSKADGSVLTPEVDTTLDFDHSKITSVSGQKLSCDIPRSPVSIINKTKTIPISVDTKGQDIGEGGQPEKEDKGEKRGKPQEKGEKRDKPQEKGEKRDKPLEKGERRDKSQEKQEQIKKRASTGASPGENGTTKDASSPGNERPESCIIS